jgi:hypothetical protein
MFETFLIALCALAISLYVQARLAAHRIRRHRSASNEPPNRSLLLKGPA